jgi:hypothetical protein
MLHNTRNVGRINSVRDYSRLNVCVVYVGIGSL